MTKSVLFRRCLNLDPACCGFKSPHSKSAQEFFSCCAGRSRGWGTKYQIDIHDKEIIYYLSVFTPSLRSKRMFRTIPLVLKWAGFTWRNKTWINYSYGRWKLWRGSQNLKKGRQLHLPLKNPRTMKFYKKKTVTKQRLSKSSAVRQTNTGDHVKLLWITQFKKFIMLHAIRALYTWVCAIQKCIKILQKCPRTELNPGLVKCTIGVLNGHVSPFVPYVVQSFNAYCLYLHSKKDSCVWPITYSWLFGVCTVTQCSYQRIASIAPYALGFPICLWRVVALVRAHFPLGSPWHWSLPQMVTVGSSEASA